jgi:hypothetical protein
MGQKIAYRIVNKYKQDLARWYLYMLLRKLLSKDISLFCSNTLKDTDY